MKKVFLSIGCVALLSMGIMAVSCKKDSDKDKGKDAGKAYCDCFDKITVDSSAEEMEKCSKLVEEATKKGGDYAKGFAEESAKCFGLE